ncbi:MAG: hypothetical protein Q9173_006582 [Seirophora scorigena]
MKIFVLTSIFQTSSSSTALDELDPMFADYGGEGIQGESRIIRLFSTFERAKEWAATMAVETQRFFGGPFTSRMVQDDQTFGYLILDEKMTQKRQLLVVGKVVDR